MAVNWWQVTRIVAMLLSFYGGAQVGLTEVPFALGFGKLGDVLMASVPPFLFMSVCTYFAARRAATKGEPRSAPTWSSNLVENSPLPPLHLIGHCALAVSAGTLFGTLLAGSGMYVFAIFAGACGAGILAGTSLSLR